ncbi:transposable element Tcb1 transposase [Trichonephila clavipes]|uniref:Transposable element Tcb1 transposase n=1 Tax=Trichonephila clavipes TaxID=2585209 RepID=A0A8X6VN83_TRICX|nr:transposable element Tcb1 transposase [Trichonephila clavipes]
MRKCDRSMQEGTTKRRGRSHPPQCTTSWEGRQVVCMKVTDRSVTSRTVAQQFEYVTHHSVSARTIRSESGPFESGHWRREDAEQLDNVRPHITRIVQRFFVNHQIELLPWLACFSDLSPIENMWSMVAQRLTPIKPPAAIQDQIWQRVEASSSAVPQAHIQSLFEAMRMRVAAVISKNAGYSDF